MLRTLSLVIISIQFSTMCVCQTKLEDINFKQVDSFARAVKYKQDLTLLTTDLTTPYTRNIDKLRAIFIWITHNIEYDYKVLVAGGDKWQRFECTGPKDVCDSGRLKFENEHVTYVLEKRKAVCSGYAQLFRSMCTIAGIKNEAVDGYTKLAPYQIGEQLKVNHTWNVVTLDGTNYLCDVTWAAGSCKPDENTGMPVAFVKQFEDAYWLTPFYKFVRNHFPVDNKWVTEPGYTKEKFFNAPFFFTNEVLKNMDTCFPDDGLITVKTGDTLHFKFTYKKDIKKIQLTTNNTRNVEVWSAGNPNQQPNEYQFDYIVVPQKVGFSFGGIKIQ